MKAPRIGDPARRVAQVVQAAATAPGRSPGAGLLGRVVAGALGHLADELDHALERELAGEDETHGEGSEGA